MESFAARISAPGPVGIDGDLTMPDDARAVVVFAHGSGSSRFSPRNRKVAGALNKAGYGTLMLDLLTRDEETIDIRTRQYRFDIERLAERLVAAKRWLDARPQRLPVGYFGASTGAAAALVAAARAPEGVFAVVSRGGRPDLAGDALPRVRAPTLLLVGSWDTEVIALNQLALDRVATAAALDIVPGATHLFEEPGALDEVARRAIQWFDRYLSAARTMETQPPPP